MYFDGTRTRRKQEVNDMTISELIANLQKAHEEFGDLPVSPHLLETMKHMKPTHLEVNIL